MGSRNKSIKLTGAALEAASEIQRASTHFETMRKRLVEITEQEVKELYDDMQKVIQAKLPIISEAVGVEITGQDGPELDLRYIPHGLAFVNIKGDDGYDVEVSTSQALS